MTTTLSNGMTPADLAALTPAQIAAFPAAELAALAADLGDAMKSLKASSDALNAGLVARYADRSKQARAREQKDTGTVRFDDGDFVIVADIAKKVDWDQAKLEAMWKRIAATGENPLDYLTIEYAMKEAKYANLPEAQQKAFQPARTVKPGKETFKIERRKEG